MRNVSGLVLTVTGLVTLCIWYLLPSSNDTAEAEQQGGTALSRPVISDTGPLVGGQALRRAERAPAIELGPAPVVVRLGARLTLPPPKTTPMPSDRPSLARALQRELQRVGCYQGQLDTGWTPLTRKAMQAFNDRINAMLPISEPTEILLTLVQSQPGRVCGAPCPPGESLADEGRCLPNAILAAQAHRKTLQPTGVAQPYNPTTAAGSTSTISSWSITATTTTTALALHDFEERMALAGPTGSEAKARAPGLTISAAASKVPKFPTPQRSNFGQSFLKRLDRMGSN